MARRLTSIIQNQILLQKAEGKFIFKINGTDFTSYIIDYSVSYDKEYGSASATFTLNNDQNKFGKDSHTEIFVGDVIELIEQYKDDSVQYKQFYGFVNQRTITKSATERSITLACLDYISSLQYLDVDLEVEGTKVEIREEILTPNYLPAPNDNLAQIFDFDNDDLASNPPPIIYFKDLYNSTDDIQDDGWEVLYDTGQLRLGSPLNVKTNYQVICRSYYFYTAGVYVEDVLEQLLRLPDGYNKYLFGESTPALVTNNHLQETFSLVEGTSIDTLTPNYTSTTLTIRTTLSSDINAAVTSISVADTSGFPTSGTGTINGDTFTWSGKTSTTLTGIPPSGSDALSTHKSGSYVKYEATYPAGQLWYLKYSNLVTNLTSSDFTIPGGTFNYLDKRFGRIILTSAISTNAVVTCNTDYVFKTLQSSGVEINRISFRPRELENRFEAVKKLLEYLPPNYIIRTQGDDKVWASLLTQKTNADYDLQLVESINYMEDEDLYTRVVLYGKNKNPSNIMFSDNVDFYSLGQTYKALASQVELSYYDTEGDYYIFASAISNAGYIDLEFIKPIVYLNNVAIDDSAKQQIALPVVIDLQTRTVTKSGCHGVSSESYVKIHTYYYYHIKLSHTNIEPSQPIYFYDATGLLVLTISPNSSSMDYARGIYIVPGEEQSSVVESISTATYTVFYSTNDLDIDYDNVLFKIRKSLIPDLASVSVNATFEYWSVMVPIHDIASVIDGRWNTQVQVEFYAEPPSGYNLTALDLGSVQNIQALDIGAGFYKPDDIRKFDISMTFSLHYSTNGTDFYLISDKTRNIKLAGGESMRFEEDDLGASFSARYIKIVLENVGKIDYEDGVWVVAFSEIAAYSDIVLKSEATLISTTKLNGATSGGESTVVVDDTSQFE